MHSRVCEEQATECNGFYTLRRFLRVTFAEENGKRLLFGGGQARLVDFYGRCVRQCRRKLCMHEDAGD